MRTTPSVTYFPPSSYLTRCSQVTQYPSNWRQTECTRLSSSSTSLLSSVSSSTLYLFFWTLTRNHDAFIWHHPLTYLIYSLIDKVHTYTHTNTLQRRCKSLCVNIMPPFCWKTFIPLKVDTTASVTFQFHMHPPSIHHLMQQSLNVIGALMVEEMCCSFARDTREVH